MNFEQTAATASQTPAREVRLELRIISFIMQVVGALVLVPGVLLALNLAGIPLIIYGVFSIRLGRLLIKGDRKIYRQALSLHLIALAVEILFWGLSGFEGIFFPPGEEGLVGYIFWPVIGYSALLAIGIRIYKISIVKISV